MGTSDTCLERGLAFLEGNGAPKDYEQAFYWLDKAQELGSEKAGDILHDMREMSLGTPRDGGLTWIKVGTSTIEGHTDSFNVRDYVAAVGPRSFLPANPRRCVACGAEALVPSGTFPRAMHCSPAKGGCGTNLLIPIAEYGLDGGLALQPYREAIGGKRSHLHSYSSLGALIHMVKYDPQIDEQLKADMVFEIARRIIECGVIERLVGNRMAGNLLVIPAPSSKKRKVQPVTLLAQLISAGKFECADALRKRTRTESKSRPKGTELAPGEISCKDIVSGRTVLLIDDTYGEGATLRACIRALRDRGARTIYYLSVCKNIYGGVKGNSADDDNLY